MIFRGPSGSQCEGKGMNLDTWGEGHDTQYRLSE